MTWKNTFVSIAVLAAVLGSAPLAHANTTATTTITQIKVLETHDKNFKLFHGAIWLELDKAVNNYRWGGSHCKNRGLSDNNLQLLFAAFRAKFSITLDYEIIEQKSVKYRCITGFTVERS